MLIFLLEIAINPGSQIVIIADRISDFSGAVFALFSLLFPLKFEGVFSPVLARKSVENGILSAPVPFIFGAKSAVFGVGNEKIGGNEAKIDKNEGKMSQNGPKIDKNGAKMSENGAKISKIDQNGPKMAKIGQNPPKIGQNSPKTGQNSPKIGQNSPKMGPKSLKNAENAPKFADFGPKMAIWRRFMISESAIFADLDRKIVFSKTGILEKMAKFPENHGFWLERAAKTAVSERFWGENPSKSPFFGQKNAKITKIRSNSAENRPKSIENQPKSIENQPKTAENDENGVFSGLKNAIRRLANLEKTAEKSGPKTAENRNSGFEFRNFGAFSPENSSKNDENLSKMAENSSKMAENRSKMAKKASKSDKIDVFALQKVFATHFARQMAGFRGFFRDLEAESCVFYAFLCVF
jgi:hypothetical protein